MFHRADLKHEVRNTIRGQWLPIFGVTLVVSLVIALPLLLIYGMSIVPAIMDYGVEGLDMWAETVNPFMMMGMSGIVWVYVILISPLGTSLSGYHLKIARKEPATIGDAFSGFRHMGPFICTTLWTMLWSMIWMMPFSVLYGVGIALFVFGTVEGVSALVAIGVVLLILSLAAYVYAITRVFLYTMSTYVIWDDPSAGARNALNESKRLMKGHRWEYFVLCLSFILWDLLSMVTCSIAELYVLPYKSVTYAAYYDYLRNRRARKRERNGENGVPQAVETWDGSGM